MSPNKKKELITKDFNFSLCNKTNKLQTNSLKFEKYVFLMHPLLISTKASNLNNHFN